MKWQRDEMDQDTTYGPSKRVPGEDKEYGGFKISSKDLIQCKFETGKQVTAGEESKNWIKVPFSHQIIEREEIRGYEELEIKLWFTPFSLWVHASVSWKSQAQDFDPIMPHLKEHWEDSLTEDEETF